LRAVQVYSNTANGQGGGFFLSNGSTLLLTDAAIYSNTAGASGGGLRVVDSTATLISATVSTNLATTGAGISLNGSSSATPANLRLTDATIDNNAASSNSGGGIALGANTGVTMTRTSIYANRATSSGGGIHLDVLSSWLDVDASSIYSNTSVDGGGIYSQGPLTLTNSTVAHNQASANGGGIYHNGGLLQTRYATLASNTATTQGGGLFLNAGTATLSNTLVANSTTNGAPGGDLQGSGAPTLAQVLTGTQTLGALRNNGGATWTMALAGGSPALDAGAGCPPPTTDQRGVTRPQGSACDIGAYEAPPMLPLTVTVAGTGRVTDLSGAINCTGACTAGFESGAVIILTATPDANAMFDGWSGACSGARSCPVTMTAAKAVTATFTACPAGVAYVNGAAGGANTGVDWPNAYTDLQDALRMYNTCGVFDEIWVARGVYTPGVTVSDTFTIPAGVALYGGFAATETQRTERDWAANVTVLSGDLGGDDTTDANGVVTATKTITGANAYQVALMVSITSTAPITHATRLDGFTITAGNATGLGYNRYGGGLFCHAYAAGSQCSPTLANITFSGNQASVVGGMAAFAEGGESSPLLSGVRFEHNTAVIKSMGGGFAALGMSAAASPVLTGVTFYSNTAAFGGGMLIVTVSNSVSSAVLNNVRFDSNAGAVGGALANIGYETGTSNPTLTDVVFRHNRTFIDSDFRAALDRVPDGDNVTFSSGGAIASAGINGATWLTLTNASLLDNRGDRGGALMNFAGGGITNVMLRNTIVADNRAILGGGITNLSIYGIVRLALTNGLLRDNVASDGGGALYHAVALASGNMAITNTTFYSNATGGEGGAIMMIGDGNLAGMTNTLRLANNILWANRAVTSSNQISTSAAATVTIASSLVEGDWNGAGVGVSGSTLVNGGGNLDGDPRFGEDAAGNLGLLPGSPAIDAGANSFVDSLIDLAGRLRIFNGIVDMGAFEAQGFDFTIAGSRAQTTPVSSAFTAPLHITVTDASDQPIGAGAAVTFVPPASGASLSSAVPFTLTTNASGVVTAAVTANGVAGSYPVTVTARGVLTPAFFMLTNLGLPVTVTVAADVNPSVYGQAVIFTATVTATQGAATPAGAVRFTVDSQTVATPTLDASGIATYTAASLAVGGHAVGASYGGDASFNAGVSAIHANGEPGDDRRGAALRAEPVGLRPGGPLHRHRHDNGAGGGCADRRRYLHGGCGADHRLQPGDAGGAAGGLHDQRPAHRRAVDHRRLWRRWQLHREHRRAGGRANRQPDGDNRRDYRRAEPVDLQAGGRLHRHCERERTGRGCAGRRCHLHGGRNQPRRRRAQCVRRGDCHQRQPGRGRPCHRGAVRRRRRLLARQREYLHPHRRQGQHRHGAQPGAHPGAVRPGGQLHRHRHSDAGERHRLCALTDGANRRRALHRHDRCDQPHRHAEQRRSNGDWRRAPGRALHRHGHLSGQ
jgi:hypothetical protein